MGKVYLDHATLNMRFFWSCLILCMKKRIFFDFVRSECNCSDDSDGLDEDLEDIDVPHKRGRKESTFSLRKLEKDARAKLKKKAKVIVEVILEFLLSLQ